LKFPLENLPAFPLPGTIQLIGQLQPLALIQGLQPFILHQATINLLLPRLLRRRHIREDLHPRHAGGDLLAQGIQHLRQRRAILLEVSRHAGTGFLQCHHLAGVDLQLRGLPQNARRALIGTQRLRLRHKVRLRHARAHAFLVELTHRVDLPLAFVKDRRVRVTAGQRIEDVLRRALSTIDLLAGCSLLRRALGLGRGGLLGLQRLQILLRGLRVELPQILPAAVADLAQQRLAPVREFHQPLGQD